MSEVKSRGSWSGPFERFGKLGEGIIKLDGNGSCEKDADG